MSFIGLSIVAWLAVENGGNDVSKGVAPLVALEIATEKTALLYGSIMTAIGGGLSVFFASKILKLFTEGLMNSSYQLSATMALAMVLGQLYGWH